MNREQRRKQKKQGGYFPAACGGLVIIPIGAIKKELDRRIEAMSRGGLQEYETSLMAFESLPAEGALMAIGRSLV